MARAEVRGRQRLRGTAALSVCVAVAVLSTEVARGDDGRAPADRLPNLAPFPNASGVARTFSTHGAVDLAGPFFQDLGTNGRSCGSRHQPADGWTVTPAAPAGSASGPARASTRSSAPSTAPAARSQDVSTPKARREAYALLLGKGLIRIPLEPPADAEFTVAAVDNPYGCGSTDESRVYRRPLPSTNLRFLSALMWDGREMRKNAEGQTQTARQGSGQPGDRRDGRACPGREALTADQKERITDFELALSTAQAFDNEAGPLDAAGARGGPVALSRQEFFLGINDPLGGNPTGAAFTPEAFTLFGPWDGSPAAGRTRPGGGRPRRAHLRHEADPDHGRGRAQRRDSASPSIDGFCATCHDAPNVGNHSLPAPLDIGLADGGAAHGGPAAITLRNRPPGETVRTSDPGRALITGQWADIGKFKGPILRGLAARAPYFHNGSAATLPDVVDFYDRRFEIGLTDGRRPTWWRSSGHSDAGQGRPADSGTEAGTTRARRPAHGKRVVTISAKVKPDAPRRHFSSSGMSDILVGD